MLYYSANAIMSQGVPGGEWRYDIKAVYCIVFMDFALSDIRPEPVVSASLRDDKSYDKITDLLRFFFIQIPLFNKTEDQCENFFDKWIYVLKNMDVLANIPESFQCEAFRKLKQVAEIALLNKEELQKYETAQRNYWDTLTVIGGAMDQGREEGRKEGATEQNIKNAKSMKSEGLSADMISRITGLSIDEINKL